MMFRKPALFFFSFVIAALLMALTLGVAAGSSHVITDEHIDVDPDGYWTAEVAPGQHQQWRFDLTERREHNILVEIENPLDASFSVSIDGQDQGAFSMAGYFTPNLGAGSHTVTIHNPGEVSVQYELYMGLQITLGDYGDAPDPTYPTLLASGGARHLIPSPWLFLGALSDVEFNGQPNATATGDDLLGIDDEDGVTFTSALVAGQPANLIVRVNGLIALGGPVLLNAWVDFNSDGDWADPNEQIFTNAAVNFGLNAMSFTVPATATPANPTFARFRVSPSPVGFAGVALFGEVEDYAVEIKPARVGGVTSFSSGSGTSAGSIALLAGAVAAVVAITAGGWYTRRRWLGSRS